MKAESSRLISQTLAANLELLIIMHRDCIIHNSIVSLARQTE